jgi:LPS sulfotransferase NodH
MTTLSRSPLFVVGCPRSGTTFLSSLLRDSSYGAPFESQFIIKYFHRLPYFEPLDDLGNFSQLLRAILRERAIRQRRVDLDPTKVFADLDEKSYPAVVDAICFEISRQRNEDVRSWGDKTPEYTLYLESLLSLFPDSRFIYLTRDGRDVALSLMKKSWGPSNVYGCALMWKDYIEQKVGFRSLETAGRALFVRYETLLQDPAAEIVRIYRYLDEPCPESELERLAATTNRSNFDKWKHEMAESQRETFERVAADTLRGEGYEVKYDVGPVSAGKTARYSAGNWVKRSLHLTRLNILDPLFQLFGREPLER